ncbi:hypothetical protein SARC_08069 [Sphaeroforma arctica JP610]|uniref:Uncharacterized protein n=1 Tax=Sphaeroforma arctica JP610 TaxID=667725 RepID=A0A0L0FRU4_9EUKA|nr:hypothetical protein SARC_08069 [Sphaeroforma arctica JP610]KNC79542.1 hypothetical protein SARC_08069 [Sphaeroforma arctica JP610]|eukprot:XP_014153444.1 hypothetical protein SARC_08069 [Sphaeroforma arctica JP610]
MTTTHPLLHVHIHYNGQNGQILSHFLEQSHKFVKKELTYTLYEVEVDPYWSSVFKQCATQRIFLPSQMPDVKRVIYFDTDMLVLRDVAHICTVVLCGVVGIWYETSGAFCSKSVAMVTGILFWLTNVLEYE